MRKILVCLVLCLTAAVCYAQSTFETNIFNGDVKMTEHFYDMALNYYHKALQAASTGEEKRIAEEKIATCRLAIDPPVEVTAPTAKAPKVLYSDQFLETGDFLLEYDEVMPGEDDYCYSMFRLEIFRDHINIQEHIDEDGNDYLTDCVLPFVEEDDSYRYYVSEEAEAIFVISKHMKTNSYGKYYEVYRLSGGKMLILYSTPQLKAIAKKNYSGKSASFSSLVEKIMNNHEEEPEETVQREREELPISFNEYWYLNLGADQVSLGDSRSENLEANGICWLTVRFRYSCPSNYKAAKRFDVKIFDPTGKLLVISGDDVKKGYSTSEVLEAIPGGGIFSVSFGSDTPGSFIKGKYIVELWYDGLQYQAAVINLN